MSDDHSKTFATRFLDKHPGIRSQVAASAGFVSWKSQFPVMNIDGTRFYLLGGPAAPHADAVTGKEGLASMMNPGADQLQEEDELILLWARQNRIVPEDEIRRFS